MGFTKLDEGILKSSIMAEPSDIFKVWIVFLAACGPDGVARISPIYIASICHFALEIVHGAISKLEAPDPESRSEAEEGRRIRRVDGGWFVINYEKYRGFGNPETPGAIRTRRWREKKQGVTVTSQVHRDVTSASASASASEHNGGEGGKDDRISEIIKTWNEFARRKGIPWIRSVDKGSAREKHLLVRLRDPSWNLEKILEAIAAQPFLTGDNDRGWLVTFDWILNPSNVTKILEGAYMKIRRGDAARRAPESPYVGGRRE